MQGSRAYQNVRRGKSRQACKQCGKPVLFIANASRARHGLHSDADHDLCASCFDKAKREGRERARAIGVR